MPPQSSIPDGNWLFSGPCHFMLGCAQLADVPASALPEVAFAGRSNVGKSSLVNALTGRNTLAKTSNTPGRTQQLNFFNLADKLILVDMPGYGYAKAPKASVAGWTKLIKRYLRGRPQLRRVCVLIDARHGPMKADRQIMDLLDEVAAPYQLVLTKLDKLGKGAIDTVQAACAQEIRKRPAAHPLILSTSSVDKVGIEALRNELAALTV